MRLIAFPRYSRIGASSRLRTYQYLSYYKNHGMDVEAVSLFDSDYLKKKYAGERVSFIRIIYCYYSRMLRLLQLRGGDVLWLEKELFPWCPAVVEKALNLMGVSYIVDYDDALFHRYDKSHLWLVRFFLGGKIASVMRNASCVVVGNAYLATYAKKSGARSVEIIPTAIDLDRYPIEVDKGAPEVIRIGWIGSPSTVKYLDLIGAALQKVTVKYNIELCVVGADIVLKGVPVSCIPWLETTEVQEINRFDIGIMPLADSSWERGKCGYKLIQYMACGIPVVASAVGANKDIVDCGVDGYLVEGLDDWVEALLVLCKDKIRRREMGKQGRDKVSREYCTEVTAPKLMSILRQVSNKKL